MGHRPALLWLRLRRAGLYRRVALSGLRDGTTSRRDAGSTLPWFSQSSRPTRAGASGNPFPPNPL